MSHADPGHGAPVDTTLEREREREQFRDGENEYMLGVEQCNMQKSIHPRESRAKRKEEVEDCEIAFVAVGTVS